MAIQLLQKGKLIAEDVPENIREKVEELFYEKYGFCPMLENGEEEQYEIYLHTEAYEDLDEEELQLLQKLSITEDGESTTVAIKLLLDIDFKLVQEEELQWQKEILSV